MTFVIKIRTRRQITLPRALMETLGVEVGDKLVAEVVRDKIILKPQKDATLEAFKELQKAFRESGVSEQEMLEELRRQRRKRREEFDRQFAA